MIPIGYMYKRVAVRPDWLGSAAAEDIHSVSGCISKNFVDDVVYRDCNGYGLFDSPEIMEDSAVAHGISLEGMTLFYYEAYEEEFDRDTKAWSTYAPGDFAPVNVSRINRGQIEGYDIASFSAGATPECSPLSCNSLAREIGVNRHCLLDAFDTARQAVESGKFDHAELGTLRIIAVYVLDPEPTAG
jgi:hypothetical protein